MAGSGRQNGKLVAGLAIGAAIVGLNFMRNRKTIRPVSVEIADMARQGVENVRRDWSERVRQATGGAEDLKGKPFWVAAGLVFASTFISACVDNAKKQSERKAEEPKGPTSEARTAAFQERFRRFRNDPRLVLGRVLPGVNVNPRFYSATDRERGIGFNYGAGRGDEADPSHFGFNYARTSDELTEMRENRGLGSGYIQGRVDYLASHENGFERIFVLSNVHVTRPRMEPEPYALSDKEVAMIADMFATVMHTRVDGDNEFPAFVIYDADAGPWRRHGKR